MTKNIVDTIMEMATQAAEERKEFPKRDFEVIATDLVNKFAEYNSTGEFKAGDLVEWKPGLRSNGFPDYGVPMILISRLPQPYTVHADNNYNAPYMLMFDVVVGVLSPNEGLFLHMKIDSNRVQAYSGPKPHMSTSKH
jgi:hypothetical protein